MQLHPAWAQCNRLLLVRLDNMGDVLMTSPAFRALKEAYPDTKLTLLTSTVGGAIAEHISEIDEVMIFDVPWVKNSTKQSASNIENIAQQLRTRAFDGAVLFTTYSQSPLPAALICYMAGIPLVLGYCRENPYRLINTWVPDIEPHQLVRHEVERQLELVAAIGAKTKNTQLLLNLPGDALQQTMQKLAAAGLQTDNKWLVLHAGVSEAKRQYPLGEYAKAVRELRDDGWQIVLTGSQGEKDYLSQLPQEIGQGIIDMVGALSLEELCASISAADLIISNNTGPVHIAAAVGTPVVVLYAQTNPQHTPWQVPSRVLYFPVPKKLRSKNQLLQTFPGPTTPQASPHEIVKAANELVKGGS